ncbi:MAG: ribosome recycling factor [Stygiobacter sp. RIFOXYC12_FULL_38_8]|nr:MAG: ribosome recycling factor [Stygiobacter sp. GWC2_38_9]OGV07559.1 MAG: ribosome recycling factor [Stygiobacter sp. RIFOXYB2_FULL_37_11]OGV10640.1 MAG: ribosome recycling factor [Stygiobacter sp. RIFOXYA2_FULL_38_8]OGV13820.1 MAG: ribosome recycling factor [Stygiobacter sp. RIFOXYC2_FULL_38_25]OGV22238.1 MAG: ribosome recycling factor [Stygiobacter sp. RIFOXYC12_FULL_38_8]OGV80204.1 MAG: ribosome recycling factor [Stygiobacter sp. GWF2_38_21]OGV92602.1 MAG: ribosome recycling factor [Me
MNNEQIKDARQRMDKTVEAFRNEIAKIRTGKATTALLDGIKVDYYGTMSPLSQVGNVSVLDTHTLAITPWDKSMIQLIDKAILASGLGLNPISDGTNIKIPIPPLNEERRKEFVKLVKKFGEESKVALRNVRRDANDHLKKQEKDKKMTEDELKEAEKETQKLTDEHIVKIDEIIKHKEKEIMEV